MGRMSWRYSINPFLMDNPLHLFRSGMSIPSLWGSLRLTWSMWLAQLSLLFRLTPDIWPFLPIKSSPRNPNGRVGEMYRIVKSTAALFPTLIAILQSQSHFYSWDKCAELTCRSKKQRFWPFLEEGLHKSRLIWLETVMLKYGMWSGLKDGL